MSDENTIGEGAVGGRPAESEFSVSTSNRMLGTMLGGILAAGLTLGFFSQQRQQIGTFKVASPYSLDVNGISAPLSSRNGFAVPAEVSGSIYTGQKVTGQLEIKEVPHFQYHYSQTVTLAATGAAFVIGGLLSLAAVRRHQARQR